MSMISSVNTSETAVNQVSSQENNVLGKDDFMTLLITQLQYQDPLNPMDSTTFTSQLAQFTSLEQLENINRNLEGLTSSQEATNKTQAVALIGKKVAASGNVIQLSQGEADTLQFNLLDDASTLNAYLYDASGELVKVIQTGALNAGAQNLSWDGTNSNGDKVDDGMFTFEILGVGVDGGLVEAETIMEGTVSAVTYENGNTYLSLSGRRVLADNIYRVIDIEE